MKRAEGIFKMLSGPVGSMVHTWKAVLVRECKSSGGVDELLRVMSLRGLTRKDQEALIHNYNSNEKSEDERIVMPKEEPAGGSLSKLLSSIGSKK
jgi:hypothetical protein